MKIYFYYLFISIIIFLIISCSKSEKANEPVIRNYIVLLDLSDRILVEGQVAKDKEIILYIIEKFISSSRDTILKYGKDINKIKDKFQLFIAHQKNVPYDKMKYEALLRIDFADKSTNKGFIFNEYLNFADSVLNELYSEAIFSTKSQDYSGADIWQFFNEDLDGLMNKSKDSQNYLFIITDGYLNFEKTVGRVNFGNRYTSFKFFKDLRKNNWIDKLYKEDYGILATNKYFRDLKVMLLQFEPLPEWNEFELMREVWSKWLLEMQIINPVIAKKDNIGLVKSKIDDFLK